MPLTTDNSVILPNRPSTQAVPRLPSLTIHVAKNGYIVSRPDNFVNTGMMLPSEMHVARSLPELMRVIKQIATEARLSGNQPSC